MVTRGWACGVGGGGFREGELYESAQNDIPVFLKWKVSIRHTCPLCLFFYFSLGGAMYSHENVRPL